MKHSDRGRLPEVHGEHHRDDTGSRLGMWIFLFTEILFFGGLFVLYSMYRSQHGQDFHDAATRLNIVLGTVNTGILLTSSLTMVLAITAVRRGDSRLSVVFLGTTILCAAVFLVNKYFEWTAEFAHGFVPGSEELLAHGQGTTLFFGLYYTMTGLHGLHVVIGAGLLGVMLIWVVRGTITQERYLWLENSGLYWHLVDVIWIFLFPLLYLIT